MRFAFLAAIFIMQMLPVKAQELLVNGSFEEENICTEFGKNCAPEGWISNSFISNYYFDIPDYGLEGIHFVGLIVGNDRALPGEHLSEAGWFVPLEKIINIHCSFLFAHVIRFMTVLAFIFHQRIFSLINVPFSRQCQTQSFKFSIAR